MGVAGVVSGRGRASNRRRRWCVTALALCVLVGLSAQGTSAANTGDRNVMGVGDTSRMIKCPNVREITPCTCRETKKGLDIACDNTEHKHVRNALDVLKKNPVIIYWMKFRNCNLPRLSDYVFLGLEVLHLHIIRSNVSAIERSSLSALGSSLLALDLSNNRIREVPTAALSMLKSLNFLNLNFNHIQNLQRSAFAGLTVLERLSLYENRIEHIDDNAFKGIGRKLLRLNLGKNQLDDIPTDTFHPLTNLEVLDLHENRIHHIPDGAFAGLHKLDMLKLEHNLITTIQGNVFSDLTVLNSLNIEYNQIVNISDNAFAGLESNMEWLELGHNRLDHIPSHALRPLHNLRQLDLESNKVNAVHEDAFRGYGDTIKYILLDKNQITRIPTLAFMDLHSLEWLKMAHNEITSLNEDTVQPILDTLTMIDVSRNPLKCGCDLLWLRKWLRNPNNNMNGDIRKGHLCVTDDRKSHSISNLPVEQFDCPRHQATEQVRAPDGAAVLVCSPALVAIGIVSTVIKDTHW